MSKIKKTISVIVEWALYIVIITMIVLCGLATALGDGNLGLRDLI